MIPIVHWDQINPLRPECRIVMMPDLFDGRNTEQQIAGIMLLIARCSKEAECRRVSCRPVQTFLLPTKYPQQMLNFIVGFRFPGGSTLEEKPLTNLWLGVNVEDQATANSRIPLLMRTPAAHRMVKAKLIGPLDLRDVEFTVAPGFFGDALQWHHRGACHERAGLTYPGMEWILCEGESGPQARPFDVDWARNLCLQCGPAGVPFYLSRLGSHPVVKNHYHPHPSHWSGMHADPRGEAENMARVILHHPKGSDMSEWPEDLRVQEVPG